MSQSQDMVNFIANLLPLYDGEQVNGVWCARSLVDGTLVLPIASEEEGEAFVTVHWQGDPQRSSIVQGSFLASLAVARYVELHHMAEVSKDTRDEMTRLAQHFSFKTGDSLCFEAPFDTGLLALVGKAISKAGNVAVEEALKKLMGI
jgi:hypothetical protein